MSPTPNFEVLRHDLPRGRFRSVLFDFDGTLSLIREGWPQVMVPMMVSVLRETGTPEPDEEPVGRACLFLPASEDELRQATNLIDRALASERARPGWLLPYFNFAKALAEYRAGRLKSALTLLDGDTQRILGPAPRLLLAMVQHRLGQAGVARDSFRAAVASYVWDARRATDREAWMYHLLRREAEIVLASRP
jgi:serine/threonine-protein kinase